MVKNKIKVISIIILLIALFTTNCYANEIRKVDNIEDDVVSIMKIADEDEAKDEKDEEKEDDDGDPDASRTFKMPKNKGNGGTTDAIKDAEKLVTPTEKTIEVVSETDLQNFSNGILNVILPVGVVIAVIIGLILGIKLMVAPASGKAEAKKLLIPYVAGCVIVFGAFGIWKIAITIMQGI